MAAVRPGFNHKAVFILSIIQLSCGALAALIGIIQIVIGTQVSFIGYGIWTGLFFIIAGILGITSWKYKNNCNIVGHMVMSIIGCCSGWVLLGLAAASVGVNAAGRYDNNDYSNGYYYNMKYCRKFSSGYGYSYGKIDCAGPLALGSLLLIISLLEIVVSIVSSAFCCKAVCCGARSAGHCQGATMQYVVSSGGGQPGQVVMSSGSNPQGYVMYPGQQPVHQMQSTVHQGSQIVYTAGQFGPQGQIVYNAQALPQGQTLYNAQALPQGQTLYNAQAVKSTQNATPVSPPAYVALDHAQSQNGQNYDYARVNDYVENGANN